MQKYNIVVLGSGGVGKSALTVQFVQEIFVERYDPTIEDSYKKEIISGNEEQFTAMRDLYMKNGQGFILCYSITSLPTFNDLKELYQQIIKVKENIPPIVLVGNKCDLENDRVVDRIVGQKQATDWRCSFFETSAKEGINVNEIFLDLERQIRDQEPKTPEKKKRNILKKCTII